MSRQGRHVYNASIPVQEHWRIHLAVYHPSVSLQSFLCSAVSRSSHNPGQGAAQMMLVVNLEHRQKAPHCSAESTQPRIPACRIAANRLLSGAAGRKRQRIQRSVTRQQKISSWKQWPKYTPQKTASAEHKSCRLHKGRSLSPGQGTDLMPNTLNLKQSPALTVNSRELGAGAPQTQLLLGSGFLPGDHKKPSW